MIDSPQTIRARQARLGRRSGRRRFRTRLFLTLALFAVIPAAGLTIVWAGTLGTALPLLSGSAAWDRVAATGERALRSLEGAPLTTAQRNTLDAHKQELETSVTQANRYQFLATRAASMVAVVAVLAMVLLAIVASRVAGHLARQLSRPLDELVRWTELIARGESLPEGPPTRGALEFEVLRRRMRKMAADLDIGRTRALEAERLRAFRETARQVAHELKNPLTPIRLAVSRLERSDLPPALADTVAVLATESARLETMAQSFSQFGRLPEGPVAEVDVGDMMRYVARTAVPPQVTVTVEASPDLPLVHGHYDALARAMSNIVMNAAHACTARSGPAGEISIVVRRISVEGDRGSIEDGWVSIEGKQAPIEGKEGRVRETVLRSNDRPEYHVAPFPRPAPTTAELHIIVRDTGIGIAPERLAKIWEPYETNKPGGTGLGLAIARQTILAHHGSVEAMSVLGQGTEIRVTLPIDGTQVV